MHGHSHSHGSSTHGHSHHHGVSHQHSGHGHSPSTSPRHVAHNKDDNNRDPHSRSSATHSTYVIDRPLLDTPSRPKSQEPLTSFKTIKPFRSSRIRPVLKELWKIVQRREAMSLIVVTILNVLATTFLLYLSSSTKSMSLAAFSYVTVFDSFALLTCFLSLWVERQSPSPAYSFGYKRTQVLAVFSATILAQLGALFSVKESIERLFDSSHVVIHSGEMVFGAIVAFLLHLFVTHFHCANYSLFNHVIEAASSSWLQEQVADLSQSLCHFMPGLSRVLLPRINPLILIGWAGFGLVLLSDLLLDLDNSHSVDTWAAIVFSIVFFGTMFPMSAYAGKILLQTIPPHVIGQLDKCLREASTLDGVLEFRHEHFWTMSFGNLAGSVHVRIRRDANEQMVLAHVHDRLQAVVSDLTIQAFKDDWATRVGGVSSSSRSGVVHHHFTGASSSSPSSSSATMTSSPLYPSGGTASLPLARAGSGPSTLSISGLTNLPTPPKPTSGNFNLFENANVSLTSSSGQRFAPTVGFRTDGDVGSRGGSVNAVGARISAGGGVVGGGVGASAFDIGSWVGRNDTSTPVKDSLDYSSSMPLDLKPPSDISHIIGIGAGSGQVGAGIAMGGTRDAQLYHNRYQPNRQQQRFSQFPADTISPIKKT